MKTTATVLSPYCQHHTGALTHPYQLGKRNTTKIKPSQ